MQNLKISEKIKAKRREHDFTQEELANLLGVTKAAVSKWENEESYPDITMLPQIARLFHMTIDELFDYTLDDKTPAIVNEYHFGLSFDLVDKHILNYGTAESCGIHPKDYSVYRRDIPIEKDDDDNFEVRIHFVSTEENIPYILQQHLKEYVLIDGYSVRVADGKIIDDAEPNKHYICKEKVWEYHTSDRKYLRNMLKEQVAMGYIDEEDAM